MKVKVLNKFNDLKENKIREVGEIFEVPKKRYEEINSTSHGTLIEEVKQTKEMKDNE
ncbi:hypothetical protein KQI42_15900 [Tissierella sp. MSJ-40]|uniref:Phage protein n=1 Tax=Tissierella simiarum TaxID=2841534 RepID=A0ABS6E999_9FIRM|nr:hypothetical protein [Tissierella simiarum]MBU5439499.1 hypothetical protein [Tissierella simiarum]